MTRAEARRGGLLRRGAVVLGVVGLAVAVALAAHAVWLGPPAAPARPDPAQVAPPPGVVTATLPPPRPVALAAPSERLRVPAVRRALAARLEDRALGRHVLAAVAPLVDEGPTVVRGRESDVAVPASTTKLVTAAAALTSLGGDRRFSTTAVLTDPRRLVLVGGGDPFLASSPPPAGTWPARADVLTLARQSARRLRAQGVGVVRLAYDDSLFTGPATSPRWEPGYVPGVISPVHALAVDQGRGAADPPVAAAQVFADALRERGVRVRPALTPTRVAGRARTVGSVSSAPVSEVVERLLQVSDNAAAEVLLRHVGLATGRPGSFAGGRAGVRESLRDLGLDLEAPEVLWDGSGLSRQSRLRPGTLVDLLQAASAPDAPELRPVVTGLPVAGFVGSLANRFDTGDPVALGRVRAKTGTLSNVFALAGLAAGPDGTPVVFALMADRIRLRRTSAALQAMDEAAAALAACRCTR